MKFVLFLVLSLSAMAFAGPAFNKNNQINVDQTATYKQQQQFNNGQEARSPAIDILKQWCQSSQMSQQELTVSFKKLVQVIKSNPLDQVTMEAVMSERVCKQQQQQQQQKQTGDIDTGDNFSTAAHELVKDVYMDALISGNSRECIEQLTSIIQSQQVEPIRAAYYMTRIAVSGDKDGAINDEQTVKQFAQMFVQQQQQQNQHEEQSEAIERQKLFATTSLIGKWISQKPQQRQQIVEVAKQVAKVIVEQHIKPVSEQEVQQYKQTEQPKQEIAKKIAKRNAALKALANIPGHVLKQCPEVEDILIQLAENKQELVTVRQSAIECLEQNDKQMQLLKQITFDQQEPIEVRVAAYRALMTTPYAAAGKDAEQTKTEQQKEQLAQEIVELVVKHCESEQNQQQDDQFVLYAISHLDNVRTSQQQEQQAIKQTIAKNKQHFMQIQVIQKKLQMQLNDVRRSSRNYKLEQEFNQIESGLVLEGDLIYESKQQQQLNKKPQVLPKLVRVNMSMPIMGQTVNVVEVTLRQNEMDEELLSVLKLAQSAKFNSETVSKVVDSFKSSVERQQQQQQQQQQKFNTANKGQKQVEADLTIKVDGCTIVYLCVDDFKYATRAYNQQQQQHQHQRNTRSIYSQGSIVEEIVEYLKRQPVAFNRGFNLNINERLAKVLDVDANILAGLRFESRAQGHSKDNFEIVAQMEPRFSFEAIVGPAKLSSKKLLQRVSTKSALGLRLRFKKDELVDIQVDLPMKTMELFTVETQLIEKSQRAAADNNGQVQSYTYLPESIYGQEDIYSTYPIYSQEFANKLVKRSVVPFAQSNQKWAISQLFAKSGKSARIIAHTFETPAQWQQATGLDGKLRLAVSPKDMSLFVSATIDKVEPQMQGFRLKVEKTPGRADLKNYLVTVSTPGSRQDRTMQVRVATQSNQQRTLVKSDISSPRMSAGFTLELVHDGRQYAIKTELKNNGPQQQWRHAAELGVLTGTSSSSGRLANFNYKPFVQVDSTSLKRPIQLQGQVAFVQSPKSVISYELKCATTGDFVQGKLIFDQRDKMQMSQMEQQQRKRGQMMRRSMRSPIEIALAKDLTLTHELIAQVDMHAVKVHNMVDWDCQKFSLQGDHFATYKNMRKSAQESQVSANMKLDQEQQVFTVERKSPSDERKQFTVRLVSTVRPAGHQMEAECRYLSRRQQPALIAYKHKIDAQKVSQNKYDAQVEFEIVDTERQVQEKAQGRVRIANERKMKQIQCELASGQPRQQKQLKLQATFESIEQHHIQLVLQDGQRFQHKTELRNSRAQFALQSRTEKPQEQKVWMKMVVEAQKPTGECKIVVEVPVKRASIAADLKLVSGKRSSLALQSGRFASQVEFTFDLVPASKAYLQRLNPFERAANLRLRSQLKDLATKQAYWMDSQLNVEQDQEEQEKQSFIRFDSPIYRADIEFSPRSQEAKLAAFARSKRSVDQFSSIYSKDSAATSMLESALERAADKLQLGPSKLWMLRSVVSSPFARDQLKQQARRALFEFADRRQQHKHSFDWSPEAERLQMELSREPNTDFVAAAAAFQPLRMKADLNTRFQAERPSTMSIDSEWMRADVEAKPCMSFFEAEDQEEQCRESYAKVSALSRHRRSPFKKHDSEIRHKRDQGYKAWMKHQDSQDQHHEMRFESDASPKKWAKLELESEKHGKANWEHKWRKHQQKGKRNTADNQDQEQDIFQNEFSLKSEGPKENKWQHETSFMWEEPVHMSAGRRHHGQQDKYVRERRSVAAKLGPIDYLKQTSGRLSSQMQRAYTNEPVYKLDFDYQPQANFASLDLDMPQQEMKHSSQLEMKPAERLYKLQSKLYNRRTQQPTYELMAATKPMIASSEFVRGLATAEQEPVFVHSSHPMLERPVDTQSLVFKLLRQPLKLDYSDKYGRLATIDYDQMPSVERAIAAEQQTLKGLRQKRAAVYFKDAESDFEHRAAYDFYPETLLAKPNKSYYAALRQHQNTEMAPVAVKTTTKYGPIVVRADSTEETCVFDLQSPIVSAKLIGETGANMQKLYKVQVDNKQQRVQLAKIVRELAPESVRDLKVVKKIVRQFDSNRFEQQTELLVSLVEQIFKIKSATKLNERPVVVIEGEWNKQTEKAYAKINGEQATGQAVLDLVRKSGELVVDVEGKHPIHHETRLVQTSDKFYSLESMTVRNSRPLFKLSGKVSGKVFEPEHLFARRSRSAFRQQEDHSEHVSVFEATLYEPKELHIVGQFDCDKKEARVVVKCPQSQKVQETIVSYDDSTETISMESQLKSPFEGQVYQTKVRVNLPGLLQSEQCMQQQQQQQQKNIKRGGFMTGRIFNQTTASQTCKSEIFYSENKSGDVYAAQYYPGEQVTVQTPRGKTTFNLAY